MIRAALGGSASDEAGRIQVTVPKGALAVDVTLTIVAETIVAAKGWQVLGAWRVIVHPAPLVLAYPASLAVCVPPSAAAGDLALLVAEDGATLPDGWWALGSSALGEQWLEARIWYFPPTHGPPSQSSSMVCLARRT